MSKFFRLFPQNSLLWIIPPASLYAFFPSSVLLHQNAHKPACSPKLAHITSVSAPYFPFLPKTANMSGQKFKEKIFSVLFFHIFPLKSSKISLLPLPTHLWRVFSTFIKVSGKEVGKFAQFTFCWLSYKVQTAFHVEVGIMKKMGAIHTTKLSQMLSLVPVILFNCL